MTDLHTLATDINEALKAAGAPLTAVAGKRTIKWFKHYIGSQSGYSIGKTEAANVLRYYGLNHLAA